MGGGVAPSALVEAIPDVVLVIDTFGEICFANRAARVQLGLVPEEWVGRSLLDLIHPDDLANVVSSMETVQGKDVGTPVEVRVRDAYGQWHWFEEIGTPISLDDGSPAILCVARNITQRRMWEVAGNDAARLRQVLQVAPAITLLLDEHGTVTGVNAAFTRMLGHDQSAVVGRSLSSFIEPGDEAEAMSALAAIAAGRPRANFEARMIVIGQAIQTCPVRFEMVSHLDDSVVSGIVVTGHDVSELVAAREELEHVARHDALTGLATRADLARRVDQLRASGRPFAVLFIDLDNFKPVNDKWGHDTGDDVLRLVARRLQQHTAAGDIVARLGGDEFVVVARDVSAIGIARRIAGRLESVISAPYQLIPGDVRIGASVGVALSGDADGVASLLNHADVDMYSTKTTRRLARVEPVGR